MKLQKFSCLSGSLASVAALFLLSNILPATGALAQSATAAAAVSLPSGPAAPFLVAPSFALAGAPTSVAMSDLNQDGKPDLVTADALTGKVTVFLGKGNGKFASGLEYATGSHPGVVAVADLNGDGHLDVLVCDEAKGTISIFSSNGTTSGNGSLQLKQTVAAGIAAAYIAVGDFNGDGKMDLAVAARQGGSLAMLLNDGKGGLQKPALSVLHKAPASLTTADFNNDGHADLALANTDGTVSILLGAGNGTFHSLPDISVGRGVLSSIVVGDFDHDGNVDLAVTQSGGKAMSVLLGKGNGGFGPATHYTVGNNPMSSLVTDLDGDGVADLVVINQGSNTYSVLGGNGDGTFKESRDYVVGNGPVAAVAGQFDVNGHVDLAVINPSSQTVTVPLGNGDGTFKAARSYLAGIEPRAVASADLNGDKLTDLVVTNYCGSDASCSKGGSVAVFLANSDGSYRLSNSYPVGAGPVSVALADVNGDKLTDIVVLNRGDKTVSVLLARGEGGFEQPYTFPVTDSPIAVAVGDFNKDGKIDLAVLGDCGAAQCSRAGSVEVLTGHGDGSFTSAFVYPTGFSPASIAVGDLNQDKNLDIVVANRCGADSSCKSMGTASVLMGGVSGKFTAAADIAVGASPSSIALADMSGRGVLDLLVSSSTANTLGVLRGNGDGSFRTATSYAIGNTPGSVAVADFDGDGKPDVAIANVADSTVSVLFGKGDGTLNSSLTLPVGTGPAAISTVAGIHGAHASLVTANGNTGAATPGTDFSVLSNIHPDLLGSGTATITVTPNPASVSVDGSSTFTIVVSGTSGTPTQTVTVETTSVTTGVEDGPITGCENIPLVAGTATCTTNDFFLSKSGQSANVFQVDYSGDSNYAIANQQFNVGVTAESATLSLAGSPAAPTVGQSVTFTATITATAVSPVGPSASITFTADGNPIAGCAGGVPVQATATTATVTCTTSSLTAGQHTILAQYGAPDFNFNVTPFTVALSETIARPATLALTSSPTAPTPTVDTAVTFTATLTATALSPNPPSGSLVFAADGQAISGCAPAVPTAKSATTATVTCTTSSLVAANHAITATYLNDPFYVVTPQIANLSQTIDASTLTASSFASSSPGNTSSAGASVTFTATLTAPAVTPIAPSGKINFTVGGNPIAGCSGVSLTPTATGGTAACTTTALPAGSDTISITYTGDSNFVLTVSPSLTQTVTAQTSTLTLSPSPSTTTVDSPVTFTATLTVTTISATPNGVVNFTLGAIPLCTAVPITPNSTGGTAKCTTSALTTTNRTVQASYNNDTSYSAAPTSFTEPVTAETAPLSLSSSAPSNTATVNTPLVFTATLTPAVVTPTAPAGTIVFKADGVALNGCTAVPAAFNATTGISTAACSSSALTVAGSPHSIAVAYTDTNGNFIGTPPAPLSETVTQATPSLVVTSSAQSIAFQAPVTFTATLTGVPITPVTPTSAAPADTVTFTYTGSAASGTTTLCSSAAISLSGTPAIATATCTSSIANSNTLPAGADNITAKYTGDSNYVGATSAPFPESVGLASAGSVTVQSSLASSSVNQLVTFTATVKASSGGPLPLGNVTFNQVGVATPLCGSQPLAAFPAGSTTTATATCAYTFIQSSPTTPTASPFQITATYDGNSTYGASTSTFTAQTVTAESLAVSLNGPSNGAINQPLTFTATLAPTVLGLSGSALPNAGTVTFSSALGSAASNPITGCTFQVTGSFTYTCPTPSFTTAGSYTIKAVYAPATDLNFTCTGTGCSASMTTVIGGAATYAASTGPSTGNLNTSVSVSTTVSSCPIGTVSPSCVVANNAPLNGKITYADSLVTTGNLTGAGCTVTLTNATSPFTAPACTVPLLSVGVHAITATFTPAAGGSYNVASSTPVNVSVSPVPTTMAITNPATSPTVDVSSTYLATVTPSYTATTPTVTGPTVPTGTVSLSFYAGTAVFTPTTPTTALCGPVNVAVITQPAVPTTTSMTTVSAACGGSLPAAGPVTIVATFVSGDSNFQSSTTTSPVNVQPASVTITISPLPSQLLVNQAVTLTATLTAPSGTGTILPTGFFTFSDISTTSPVSLLCTTPTLATGSLTASCTAALLTAGTRTIKAAFTSANTSFNAPSNTANVTISSAPTAVTLIPSSPTSVATQPVEFTALVKETPPAQTPSGFAYQGSAVPKGSVTFTSSDPLSTPSCGTNGDGVVSVTSTNQSGSATASCAFSFNPKSPAGVTIMAAYSSTDNNFQSSNGTETQNLQNFSVAFTPSTSITLTQGYSNGGSGQDPFNPANITVNSVPNSSVFPDTLKLTCQAQDSSGNVVTVLSCAATPSPIPGNGTSPATFTVSALSTAPVGLYTATITATDTTYPALSHTATLPIYVVSSAGTLSLGPGTSVTESLTFNTAPPTTTPPSTLAASLNSFDCGQIFQVTTSKTGVTTYTPYAAGGFTCTAGVSSPVQIKGNATLAPVTIAVSGTLVGSTSKASSSSPTALAALWGVPLLALLVWLGNRKSPRRNFFRFLGVVLLVAGLANVIGCGGSFTAPKTPTGGPPIGTYSIQVVATDSNGITHSAVVPLVVN